MESLRTPVLLLLLVFVALPEQPRAANVLVLNDLHLQIFYSAERGADHCFCLDFAQQSACGPVSSPNATLGQLGCDSPAALLQAALTAAAAECPKPAALLVLGDAAGHDVNIWAAQFNKTTAEAAAKILEMNQHVAALVHAAFPGTPTAFSIGNNDVYPDYETPSLADLQNLQAAWNFSIDTPAKSATFLQAGYYRSDIPGTPVSALMLSTNIFHTERNCSTASAPSQMLGWLEVQLGDIRAAGRKAWICGHIPPAYNQFPSRHAELSEFWTDCFAARFNSLVTAYADVVTEMLFAHEHRALYEGLDKPTSIPLRVHPAVSPIYMNNPGFRCYQMDPSTGALLDYTDYFTNISASDFGVFKPLFPSATVEYSLPSLARPAEYNLVGRLTSSLASFAVYWSNAVMGRVNEVCPDLSLDCVHKEICALRALQEGQYEACVAVFQKKRSSSTSLSTGDVVGIALGAAAFVVLVVVVYLFLHRRRRQGFDGAHNSPNSERDIEERLLDQ